MSDTAVPDLAEMRQLARSLPGPDQESATAAMERQRHLLKPPGALGRLEEIAVWLATWQGRSVPRCDHPRVAVFAGNHGIAARGVSAYPPGVTQQMVAAFVNGHAAVNQLAQLANADLQVHELDLETPTADFTTGPALGEEDAARAMAYGMMAVDQGLDLICLGEMGIGNTTAASALACALFGGRPADWVGPGTGVDAAGRERKAGIVAEALEVHDGELDDGFEILRRLGGNELAAIVGAVLAARMAGTPVLLDGFACTAAAAVLLQYDPDALDHCMIAHCSAEPGHRRLLQAMDRRPLLDLDMRLGEASGAAVAIALVKAAVACHNGMATFAEAGVSGKA